jgi:hypothetical protein
MSPRKRVLIWSQCEATRSVLRIVLDAHGYGAVKIAAEREIWAQAVAVGLKSAAEWRIESRLRRTTGCVLVSVEARGGTDEGAWMSALLWRLRVATQRRRGPKAGVVHARSRATGTRAKAAMDKRARRAA